MDSIVLFQNSKFRIVIPKERATLMICMAIALIFWFFLKMSKVYETVRTADLEYTLPAGLAFIDTPPTEIDYNVEGTGWNLMYDFFISGRPIVQLDLVNESTNMIERDRMINRIKGKLYSGVQVLDVSEDFLFLNFEERIERKLPIQLDAAIAFQPGYDYKDSISLIPDSVLVSGPASIVNNTSYWTTNKLEAENLRGSLFQELRLKAPEKGQIILNPKVVQVNVPVEEFTEKSVFIPVTVKNAPDSIRIFPAQIQIKSVVGLSKFNDINPTDYIIEADLQGVILNDENNTVPLSLIKSPTVAKSTTYFPQSVEFFIIQ